MHMSQDGQNARIKSTVVLHPWTYFWERPNCALKSSGVVEFLVAETPEARNHEGLLQRVSILVHIVKVLMIFKLVLFSSEARRHWQT